MITEWMNESVNESQRSPWLRPGMLNREEEKTRKDVKEEKWEEKKIYYEILIDNNIKIS